MGLNSIAARGMVASLRNARYPIARAYALQGNRLTSATISAAFHPRRWGFSFGSPAGIRWVSEAAPSQDQATSDDSTQTRDLWKFSDEIRQKAADKARAAGWVVLKTSGARGEHNFLKFGPFFLRENCQCSSCVHPDTKQRAFDPFSIPEDVSALEAVNSLEGAIVKWSDGHESIYPWIWLKRHQQNKIRSIRQFYGFKQRARTPRRHQAFNPESGSYPEVLYEDVMAKDEAVLQWLENIWTLGFCFVKGVPVNPESTKALIERIAFIRHTHYGGFWDFTADLTFKDTAYTNEFLGGHTDNTYFTDPARLQLFHLLSHTDGSGGASLLVDGFAAAKQLFEENRDYYTALADQRHPWHASGNEDVCIQPSTFAPVFSEHLDMNRVYQIRWNNYDRAPKVDWKLPVQEIWYKAARRYDEILKEEKRQIWTQLEPGTALIFDNWRMLHGRSQFTGKRRMCGGYVNNDDFISRLRLLKFGREHVLDNLGNLWDADSPKSPYYYY